MNKILLASLLVATSFAQPINEALPFAGAPRVGANDTVPPPAPVSPTDEQLKTIKAKLAEFRVALAALQAAGVKDDLVVDAESYGWVVENVVRVPGGFIDAPSIGKCVTILNDGLRRIADIKAGTAAWPTNKGRVNRAYRSAVDGTAQPYRLSIPASYDPAKPIALYVYLHGRSHDTPDLGLTWVGGNDNASGNNGGGGGGARNYMRVDAFGRGNNSFRWAGETDIFEVIASISQRYNIDPNRILLAGFSMGGAGSWQVGLNNADMFCGLEIDAGVIGNRLNTAGLTPAQKAANSTYGLVIPHALNVFNIPLVGYAGANDAQLASSTSIREQLGREGFTIERTGQYRFTGKDINALFLANPGQGHSHATGETAAQIDQFTADNFARGRVVPDHIRFVTYTTRYNRSHWVTVDGLQQHFERADVDAQRDATKATYTVKTTNVSRLILTDTATAQKISIDGDTLNVKSAASLLLVRNAGGHWQTATATADTGLRKQHNLQGPITDAFFDSFLCVSPTGQAFNALAAERGQQEQARFAAMFARDFCGEARSKNDTAINAADIAANNLVLFGDPGSNKVLAQIAAKLPIQWTKDSIKVGGKTYRAAEHVPVLIYPNPLNPKRYVVINAGLPAQTRGAAGFGDYAVLKLTRQADGQLTTETADEGVFDESWQLPAAKI